MSNILARKCPNVLDIWQSPLTPVRAWAVIAGQIIQDSLAIFVLERRAPACHFLQLAVPLRARQALLADDVFFVATPTGIPEAGGRCWGNKRRLRRFTMAESSATTSTCTRGITFQP